MNKLKLTIFFALSFLVLQLNADARQHKKKHTYSTRSSSKHTKHHSTKSGRHHSRKHASYSENYRHEAEPAVKDEIIYHVFQRSFFDSNGDSHGDLNGLRQKLDYIQQLGATALLLTPLYESIYYHNYFAINFRNIDPKYGTLQDYLDLIKELHKRGMKFYMDMETQYVTEDDIWWKDSFGNLRSKYSDYIIYDDSAHIKPTSIVANLTELKGYDGVTHKITTANLNNEKVKEYNYQLFKFFVDPNSDGSFDDGVDGFRLDHMMDNLDNKGILPHLFTTFWNPLLNKLRQINPKLNIVAEQANWGSLGLDYLQRGGVDRVFAFRLAGAIRSFHKSEIIAAADSTFLITPANKQQVVFIENHDMPRFSYVVKGKENGEKLKIGCALNLLIGGVPAIYYGQELGMSATTASVGMTDANEIPVREAFEWYRSDTGPGMAFWYKKTGPWADKFNNDIPDDGISLEEEKPDPNSLWNFYRKMIALRKSHSALVQGTYKTLQNDNEQLYSFIRSNGDKKIIVTINLSDKTQDGTINLADTGTYYDNKIIDNLYGKVKPRIKSNSIYAILPAYGIEVWEVD